MKNVLIDSLSLFYIQKRPRAKLSLKLRQQWFKRVKCYGIDRIMRIEKRSFKTVSWNVSMCEKKFVEISLSDANFFSSHRKEVWTMDPATDMYYYWLCTISIPVFYNLILLVARSDV